MNRAYAFFDVDGTLLRANTMLGFHNYWYQHWTRPDSGPCVQEYEAVTAILRNLIEEDAPRELINRRYYEFFQGRSVDEVQRCALSWACGVIADPRAFVTDVLDKLTSLRNTGFEPVFVSGSFLEALAPIAEHLDVTHVLATRLVQENGKYSGRFLAPQTIGEGKATAISAFLALHGGTSQECWAFGDDLSDLHMLDAVGHPVAVIGDPLLAAVAVQRGWRCLHSANERP